MNLLRSSLAVAGTAIMLVAAGCGGGGSESVPSDAVAVVNGTAIPRAELDKLLANAKKGYEAQNREFPRVGTPEYVGVQNQYVKFLVQLEQYEQEGAELGVEVTDKDVDAEIQKLIKDSFGGRRSNFEKALKDQGYTETDIRGTYRASVLAQKLFDAVTKDVTVPEAEILEYYRQNRASYGAPESRDVRHILISEKKEGGAEVDFAKSKTEADRLLAELRAGGDFAALARANSDDPGSKAEGGKLTISRGQTVPEFDKTSFDLDVGKISEPVKTTYGYHIIEALTPVRKATSQPLDEVRPSIKATLLQEKRTDVMTEWLEELENRYDVSYAQGFEPPDLPEETNTETIPAE
jgi:foldase protein PrsA